MKISHNSSIEIPSGLIKTVRTSNLETVELRETLKKAVKDADLNVTERWALNKKFFPNGGGFDLFPKGKDVAKFSYYMKKGDTPDKLPKFDIPEHVTSFIDYIKKSSKNTYQGNLDSALKKLKNILNGKI